MNSRERVLTAFAHQEPDRVPAWCGASPEFWDNAKEKLNLDDEGLFQRFGDDFRRVFAKYVGPEHELAPDLAYRTIFGIERKGHGYGQPTSHPLANASLDEIHNYPWPDPAWMDVSGISADAQKHNRKYAILGGDWSPFWHDLVDMLGMEQMYYKMYDSPELVDAILKHLVDFYFENSCNIFEAAADDIDIFFIGNDLGSQTGPLVSVELFDRFIKPQLKRLIDLGHDYNLKVMLHCCGGFAELIPGLIEIGMDGVHAIQPCCRGMELDKLKDAFGDKMLFNGAIDSHHVLINGSPELVKEKTRQVLDIMMPGGGYVAGASHDYILEETPLENILAMFDTIQEYGVYK